MKYAELVRKLPRHILEFKEGKKSFLSSIYAKRFDEQNFFITSIGMPGAGKSTALLKLLWELQVDPITKERNFDVEKQVVFDAISFLKLIKETNPKTNPGFGILFDEIEIDANARGWDKINRMLELAISTMRFKQNILCASLPHERQLMKSVRRLRNAYLDCKFVNHYDEFVYAKFYHLDYNMTADTLRTNMNIDAKRYKHRFFAYDKSNQRRKYQISSFRFKLPPRDIIKTYKKKKTVFLNTFYENAIQGFEKEDKKNANTITYDRFAEFVDRNKDEFAYKARGKIYLHAALLSEALKIPKTQANDYCKIYTHKQDIKVTKKMSYVD